MLGPGFASLAPLVSATPWQASFCAQKRRLAKANPALVLRYRSKATALGFDLNPMSVSNAQGMYFDVWREPPSLCFFTLWRHSLSSDLRTFG